MQELREEGNSLHAIASTLKIPYSTVFRKIRISELGFASSYEYASTLARVAGYRNFAHYRVTKTKAKKKRERDLTGIVKSLAITPSLTERRTPLSPKRVRPKKRRIKRFQRVQKLNLS